MAVLQESLWSPPKTEVLRSNRANYKYCIANLNQEHALYKGGVKLKLNILCARVEEIWWSVNAGEGMCIVYRATSW